MKINMKGSGRVNIDGRDFVGGSIVIQNGKVIVDGVVQDGELVGNVNVQVHGDVVELDAGSGNVVARNVGNITTGSGDVECHDVLGNIRTGSGGVRCGKVGGSIKTGSGGVYHG